MSDAPQTTTTDHDPNHNQWEYDDLIRAIRKVTDQAITSMLTDREHPSPTGIFENSLVYNFTAEGGLHYTTTISIVDRSRNPIIPTDN